MKMVNIGNDYHTHPLPNTHTHTDTQMYVGYFFFFLVWEDYSLSLEIFEASSVFPTWTYLLNFLDENL